jgi:hypothetical protein
MTISILLFEKKAVISALTMQIVAPSAGNQTYSTPLMDNKDNLKGMPVAPPLCPLIPSAPVTEVVQSPRLNRLSTVPQRWNTVG